MLRDIKIWMNTPEKTVEEMENIMNSIQPVCAHKMVVKGPKIEGHNLTKI